MIPNRNIGRVTPRSRIRRWGPPHLSPGIRCPCRAHGAAVSMQEDENAVSTAIQARLNKKQFQNVKVTVANGVATLSGTVDLYEYKADADKRTPQGEGVNAVRNEIQVVGSDVSDDELKAKTPGETGV